MKVLAIIAAIAAGPVFAEAPAQPTGYRMEEYRAPVPAALDGAVTIGAEQAHQLWTEGVATFVDVLPKPPKPAKLPEGTIWRERERVSVPGAMWLPNTGYGALAEVTQQYYQRGLDKAAQGDKAHPLVIFCKADCWMSWNAAKRALEYGYTNVYWMPGGTDGWGEKGYPTQQIFAEPEAK